MQKFPEGPKRLMEEHDDKLAEELKEIRDLLGRFHNQKIFYRPKDRFGRAQNKRTPGALFT